MKPEFVTRDPAFGGIRAALFHRFAIPLLAVAATILGGCAAQNPANRTPGTGEGIAEYRKIIDESREAIARAVSSLNRVSAQTNSCPPRLVSAFSREIQHLQADSIKVRSRTQAIQARGDAYFERWQETLEQVKDGRVRELAAQRRPQLQESFTRLKLASRQAGDAFRPFLSGLRKLQNNLEGDPASTGTDSTRELIRTTRQGGVQVVEALAAVRQELDAMTAMLKPDKAPGEPSAHN